MKKLMIAAAVAAMSAGAFAAGGCGDDPEPQEKVAVPRVYQIQLNTYTTGGHALGGKEISGGQCGEPTTTDCLVMRGKEKTVIRGYIYICDDGICGISSDYSFLFADVKRKGLMTDSEMEWDLLNVMGVHDTDAEAAWTLKGTMQYDVAGETARAQAYDLRGAGYGKVKEGATLFFDNLSGYFAGTAGASYDFKTPKSKVGDCACEASKVITCDTCTTGVYEEKPTVAFGTWKMKFNANLTKKIAEVSPDAYLLGLLQKMFK